MLISCVALSLLCDAVPDWDDVLDDETKEVWAEGLRDRARKSV